MKDQIKLIKLGWKSGMTLMIVVLMAVGSLTLNPSAILATGKWSSPSPSPVPSPTPKSCSDCGGSVVVDVDSENNIENENENKNINENENTNEQKQKQDQEVNVTQENNQTVNVTSEVPLVAGETIPLKQPETGVGVLGAVSMASAVPLGFVLSRFGRGRVAVGKREESLGELASELVNKRSSMSQEA